MKQKSFETLMKRLHGLTPDQVDTLMQSVHEMTALSAAHSAIDKRARECCCPHCSATEKQK